uniref:Uncharacterized protein n=1 Tax=Glycine max TaxID=3847 RepID=A0A0R0IVN4_SOYBN
MLEPNYIPAPANLKEELDLTWSSSSLTIMPVSNQTIGTKFDKIPCKWQLKNMFVLIISSTKYKTFTK